MVSTKQVFWNGNLVGWYQFKGADNFHVFGNWKATDTPTAIEFCEIVAKQEEAVWVTIEDGSAWYSVSGIEFGEIEFLFNPVGPSHCGKDSD